MRLDRLGRGRRRLVAPQGVDDRIGRDHPPRPAGEQGQEPAPAGPGDVHLAAVRLDGQRPEHATRARVRGRPTAVSSPSSRTSCAICPDPAEPRLQLGVTVAKPQRTWRRQVGRSGLQPGDADALRRATGAQPAPARDRRHEARPRRCRRSRRRCGDRRAPVASGGRPTPPGAPATPSAAGIDRRLRRSRRRDRRRRLPTGAATARRADPVDVPGRLPRPPRRRRPARAQRRSGARRVVLQPAAQRHGRRSGGVDRARADRHYHHWFWPLGATVTADGTIALFVAEFRERGSTYLSHAEPVATWVALIDPVTLTAVDLRPAPDPGTGLYGWSVASDDQHTYLYGHCYRQFGFGFLGPRCVHRRGDRGPHPAAATSAQRCSTGTVRVGSPSPLPPPTSRRRRRLTERRGPSTRCRSRESTAAGSPSPRRATGGATRSTSTAPHRRSARGRRLQRFEPEPLGPNHNTYFASIVSDVGGDVVVGLSNNAWDGHSPDTYRPTFTAIPLSGWDAPAPAAPRTPSCYATSVPSAVRPGDDRGGKRGRQAEHLDRLGR